MLREPWNMSKESSVDEHENNGFHLIAINEKKDDKKNNARESMR